MKRLLIICITSLITTCSLSQLQISRYVNASAGMEMSNASLQVSYTIGETFTSTMTQSGSTNTLGFQQSGQSVVSLEENEEVTISLFPNPATYQLTLSTSSAYSYSYKIFDITGRLVEQEFNHLGQITVGVTSLVEGKYFLEYNSSKGNNTYLQFIVIH